MKIQCTTRASAPAETACSKSASTVARVIRRGLGAAFAVLLLSGFPGCPMQFPFLLKDAIFQPPLIRNPGQGAAVDAAGNRYVAGEFYTGGPSFDYNPRPGFDLKPDGVTGRYIFVTRFNPDGTYAWSQFFGSPGGFSPTKFGAITLGGGRVYVTGGFSGDFLIGGPAGVQITVPQTGGFVVALDPATGNPMSGFGTKGVAFRTDLSTFLDEPRAIALSEDNATLYVGGSYFNFVLRQDNGSIVAFDAVTGVQRDFGGTQTQHFPGAVRGLVARGNRLFAVSDFGPTGQEGMQISSLNATTGEFDTAFGNGGQVTFGSANGRAIGTALAISSDGVVCYATGSFSGSGFGFRGNGTIAAAIDGVDTEDLDSFVIALDAATGQPRQSFGIDTDGDGQGDGVAVFTDIRLNVAKDLVTFGDSANGALFLLANSPQRAFNGFSAGESDAHVARLHSATGAFDAAFGADGIQSFGGTDADAGADLALGPNLLLVAGRTFSSDAGVGGPGKIGALESLAEDRGAGFLLELDPATGAGLNAGPRVLRTSPDAARAGGAGFNLVVHGARFTAQSVVHWNDSPRPTTYIDGFTLAAAISATDIAAIGTAQVSVFEPDSDQFDFNDVFSNDVVFEIAGSGAAPVLTALDPESRPVGGHDFFLTVRGSGFENGALVMLDNQPRFTQVMAPDAVRATIPRADLAGAAFRLITVTNPGSARSAALRLIVGNPVIDALDPNSIPAGGPSLALNVRGSLFARTSTVLFGGAPRPTVFINNTLLQAIIPAGLIDRPGQVSVTVDTPGSGRSLEARTFTITAPGLDPFIFNLDPTALETAGPAFLLTVLADNFDPDAVVLWNGSPRGTAFLTGPPRLQAQISAEDTSLAEASGGADVQVRNSNGQVSAPVRFIVGPPELLQLQPASAIAGGPQFTLTAIGNRFDLGAFLTWNGEVRTTTYISPTQLTAVIANTDIAQPGEAMVHVFNRLVATPSSPLPFQIAAPAQPGVPFERPISRAVRLRDRDGDGWVDDLERLLGSSPASAASTPPGFSEPLRINAIESLAPHLKMARVAKGRIILSGRLPLPPDFDPTTEPVYAYAEGRVRTFRLNAHGSSSSRRTREIFRLTRPGRATAPGTTMPFVLRLSSAPPQGAVAVLLNGTVYYLPANRLPRR